MKEGVCHFFEVFQHEFANLSLSCEGRLRVVKGLALSCWNILDKYFSADMNSHRMNVFSNFLCGDTLFSVAELGLVLTRPEKFKNGGISLWKRFKSFPSTLRWRKLTWKRRNYRSFFSLCLRRSWAEKSPKSSVLKVFRRHWLKRKVGVFKFLRFQERDGLVWTAGLTIFMCVVSLVRALSCSGYRHVYWV